MKIEYLESFIDKKLKCKKRINEETDEEFYEQYIRLCDIEKLKLSDEEVDFVFKYLEKKGINVCGSYQYYSGVYDNYKQVKDLNYYTSPKYLENYSDILKEYQETKDKEQRAKLIEASMRLVKIIAMRYEPFFNIDKSILESYGYEGLIKAIDKSKSTNRDFNSYIRKYIKGYIVNGVTSELLGQGGPRLLNKLKKENKKFKHFEYNVTLSEIEEENSQTIKENPDLFDLVFERLKEIGYGNKGNLEELRKRASLNNTYSVEQLDEELQYCDEDSLYNYTIEKLFQEELKNLFNQCMSNLSYNEQYTLKNYNFGSGTYKSIGDEINMTPEGVRKAGIRAYKKLVKNLLSNKNRDRVNSFFDDSNYEYSNNQHTAYIKK